MSDAPTANSSNYTVTTKSTDTAPTTNLLLGYVPDPNKIKKTPLELAIEDDIVFDNKVKKFRDLCIVAKNNYDTIESSDLESKLQMQPPEDQDLA